MSKAVAELNEWLGLRHKVSLVDVHTSNGCENTNRQVIQHLSALCNDLRCKDKWTDPKVLGLIQLHFNGSISAEAGISPFQALFGSQDQTYYKLDPSVPADRLQFAYTKKLDDCLKQLRQISAKHQAKIVSARTSEAPVNQFVVGDLVLKNVKSPTKHWKPEKIGPSFYGPYQVTRVRANDYDCKHITDGTVECFHVSALKPYFGTVTMAKRAALLDHDQYVVTKVSQYIGDPEQRTSMEFLMTYADGDEQWNAYYHDLSYVEAFRSYCESIPELWPMLYTEKEYRKMRIALNKSEITELSPGDVRYVDLRSIDQRWYNNIEKHTPDLPNEHSTIYVALFHMVEWVGKSRTKIATTCPLLNYSKDWNHSMVKSWGSYNTPLPHHVLVDKAFLAKHPAVLESLAARRRPLEHAAKPVKKQRRPPPAVPAKRGRPRLKPVESKVVEPTAKLVPAKVAVPSKPKLVPVTGLRRSSRFKTTVE